MKSKKLLVVGELNMDLILNDIKGFPEIGTEIVAGAMDFTLGSSSAIMASNISALGVGTSFCGMIGDDRFGQFILEQLQLRNVGTKYIQRTSKYKTGVTVVMSYDQDRANITYCGAMGSLDINRVPWENINDFDHFHLSSYFLQKGIKEDIARIFEKAKSAGLTTSLDLQYDPDGTWDFDYKACLPFVDVFLPNEAEIRALTGKGNNDAALEELKPFANTIALKLGKNGSRLVNDEMDIEAPPYTNDDYRDAIGAGDSFNAGFLQKFLEGAPAGECLGNGNLMGAVNTTCAGGTGAFSSREGIKEKTQLLLKGNGGDKIKNL